MNGRTLCKRFGDKGDETRSQVLDELDDLRNLFAHNFAGVADDPYLDDPRRLGLKRNADYDLTCGLPFSGVAGERIRLKLDHLVRYIEHARAILASV